MALLWNEFIVRQTLLSLLSAVDTVFMPLPHFAVCFLLQLLDNVHHTSTGQLAPQRDYLKIMSRPLTKGDVENQQENPVKSFPIQLLRRLTVQTVEKADCEAGNVE